MRLGRSGAACVTWAWCREPALFGILACGSWQRTGAPADGSRHGVVGLKAPCCHEVDEGFRGLPQVIEDAVAFVGGGV